MHRPFNSTRCIRNAHTNRFQKCPQVLSTPRSALGTQNAPSQYLRRPCFQLHTVHQELKQAKQSIRVAIKFFQLHTVHQERSKAEGILGGCYCFQLHTVHQEQRMEKLTGKRLKSFQLHTVHQELCIRRYHNLSRISFNSTRCIRNRILLVSHQRCCKAPFNSTRCIRNKP